MSDYRVAYVNSDGDPVAVFLDSAEDCNPGNLMTFARMGEHNEGSIEWVREQSLASEDQYRDLHSYLARLYLDGPAVAQGAEPLNLVIDQAGLPR